ncbi:2-polyprenyl-6-methoxyphenol hydroxylase-like FAD-dependent oxidoreductase [Streptomyces sp. PanSC19]|uniref:FAD-dependent monooxygenase n=1 Tax=Streptomyces sp. PanSC19 TaxID=1520455 RepID=UPI000F4814E1|nr:FAD-dependent monooxygenase [Streptomyces sp. PanSC19]ROQ26770.1 2-polyprenyl-6-methoxyphenol hydroxylase-like FAD-dependent oxidoreductase [Streptomyces sp. PanSC19]
MDGGNAVVVGGGIGGLAAAIGLRRVGWEVTVLERATALGDAGAGISLHANGIRALDALGIGAGVREAARPQYTGGTRVPGGGWLARMDGAALERALGTPIVGIPRAVLHRLLREALPAECLAVGAEVTSLDLTAPDRVGVVTGEGVREADLVVAADGVNSALRRLLFPGHPGPAYSGSTVLRAVTEAPVPLATDFELTWGRGAEFGHIAFTDGRAEWHAVLNAPPGVRHPDPLAVLRRRFREWHEPIPALLAATRPEAVLHHDIHELATPLPTFVSGRVALLGDAAHAMTPNLGQGACQALEDAVSLAAALAGASEVGAALARYDAERRPRSQSVARAARQAGRMGQQLSHPVAVSVRNTVLRAAPDRATLRAILRHADWTPPALRANK